MLICKIILCTLNPKPLHLLGPIPPTQTPHDKCTDTGKGNARMDASSGEAEGEDLRKDGAERLPGQRVTAIPSSVTYTRARTHIDTCTAFPILSSFRCLSRPVCMHVCLRTRILHWSTSSPRVHRRWSASAMALWVNCATRGASCPVHARAAHVPGRMPTK